MHIPLLSRCHRETGARPGGGRRALAATAVAAALSAWPVSASGPPAAAATSCSVPTSVSAAPNAPVQGQLAQYGNTATGWTGGDGPHSATLPDGRRLWFFDDTFLGTMSPNGVRSVSRTPLLRNSIVLQDAAGNFSATLHQTIRSKPASFVTASTAIHTALGYWPGGVQVVGNELYVLMSEFRFTHNAFRFDRLGDYLAEFDLPGLGLHSITALPAGPIQWTQWVLSDGPAMYVYGYANFKAYVAQVGTSGLAPPWLFWTGSGWSGDVTQAAPIGAAGGGFSVTKQGSAYVLVTTGPTGDLENTIDVSYSCSSTGPFSTPEPVYRTPEPTQYPSSYHVMTYDAHAQPAVGAGSGSMVVSYDVNAPGTKKALAVVSVYRPRFVTLTFS